MHRIKLMHVLRSRPPTWSPAVALVLVALTLGACGGDASPDPAPPAAATDREAGAGSSEPDPSADGGSPSSSGSTAIDGGGTETQASEPSPGAAERCGDVAIVENSGSGLFGVVATGIGCEEATAALQEWGAAGFPGDSPEGFSCTETEAEHVGPSARLRCEADSGGTIAFTTGT